MLSGATFYDCINTLYQFIEPFLDNKMSIFLGILGLEIEIRKSISIKVINF